MPENEITAYCGGSDFPVFFPGHSREEVAILRKARSSTISIEVLEGGKGNGESVGLFVGPYLLTMTTEGARALANALNTEAALQEARSATLGDVDDGFLEEPQNN